MLTGESDRQNTIGYLSGGNENLDMAEEMDIFV